MQDKMLTLFLVLLLIFSAPILLIYGLTKMEVIETPFVISGYQGLHPSYDAVYWNGYWYDKFNKGPNPNYGGRTASVASFTERIALNPDGNNELLPTLKMSGTQILVDPDNWKSDTYTFQLKNEGESTDLIDVYDQYQMEKVLAEWKVNVWIDGSGNEAKPLAETRWVNAEIWIKLTPQNFAYFVDNADELYFAPAYIGVDSIEWYSGKDDPDQTKDPTQAAKQEFYPEVRGDSFAIFAGRGETSEAMDESKILSYQGRQLDPEIFKDEYWIRFNIDKFQAYSWWTLSTYAWEWKYVSAHITFEVHLFVIGHWRVVLEKGDIPDLEPREVDFGTDAVAEFFRNIGDFIASPLGIFLAFIGIILAVFIILALTGALPGIISLLTMMAGAKRKKGGG